MGIEPTCSAWKADILPLNYTRKNWRLIIITPLAFVVNTFLSIFPALLKIGLVLKMAMCPAARDFFVRQGDFPQEYLMYFKENQRSMTEKAPQIGHVVHF